MPHAYHTKPRMSTFFSDATLGG